MPDADRAHIVVVTITFDPEPGALRGLPLAKRLVQSGKYDVTVVTAIPWYPLGHFYPGYRLRLWQWETMSGVRVLRVPLFPSHDRSAIKRIATYLTFMISGLLVSPWVVRKADLIYHVDNLPTTGLLSCALGAIWGAPIVQHIGDLWPDSVSESGMVGRGKLSGMVARTIHAVQRFVYARNRVITVITDGFSQTLQSRGVPAERIRVVPNWADEERFQPVEPDRSALTALGVRAPIAIVYAGNVGPLQALDVVVDAAELTRDDASVEFVIVGDGPALPALRERASRANLRNVIFAGRLPVERMAAVNAAADALLVHLKDVPFLHATVPSKTQVSMLAGKPLLMGARGDAARLVTASGGGLVFEPESGASLAGAVSKFAGLLPVERQAMGARGRDYYDAHLSMAAGVETMQRIFDETVSASINSRRRSH